MQEQHNLRADGDDDFAALFEKNTQENPEIREGTIVLGTIVDVIGDYAVVDVGCKAEGQVPLREFAEEDGTINVQVGDKIEVLLEAQEDNNGLVVLSKDKARKRKVWTRSSRPARPRGSSAARSRRA